MKRERFLVITLPAVENKRSGAVEVAGIIKYTPRQDTQPREKIHNTTTPLVERILVLGKALVKGTVRVFHILISLSAICALESSREFTAPTAETEKSLTSWIESLTSVDASEFLT